MVLLNNYTEHFLGAPIFYEDPVDPAIGVDPEKWLPGPDSNQRPIG